jgi:hypothetical protein
VALAACGDANAAADGAAPGEDVTPSDPAPPGTSSGGASSGGSSSSSSSGGSSSGSTPPPTPDTCDLTKPFGAPVKIGIASNVSGELILAAAMTSDEKTFFINRQNVDGLGRAGTVTQTRTSRSAPFGPEVPEPSINPGTADANNNGMWLSADSLTAYASVGVQPVSAQFGVQRITRLTRSSVGKTWSPASSHLLGLAPEDDHTVALYTPFVAEAESALYYSRSTITGFLTKGDLYRTSLSALSPAALTELNTEFDERAPVLTTDGLTIYWGTSRDTQATSHRDEVFTASRTSTSAPFSNITRVESVKTTISWPAPDVIPVSISTNHCRLYILERGDLDHHSHIAVATRP